MSSDTDTTTTLDSQVDELLKVPLEGKWSVRYLRKDTLDNRRLMQNVYDGSIQLAKDSQRNAMTGRIVGASRHRAFDAEPRYRMVAGAEGDKLWLVFTYYEMYHAAWHKSERHFNLARGEREETLRRHGNIDPEEAEFLDDKDSRQALSKIKQLDVVARRHLDAAKDAKAKRQILLDWLKREARAALSERDRAALEAKDKIALDEEIRKETARQRALEAIKPKRERPASNAAEG